MASYVWNGSQASKSWENADNYTPSGIPGAGDTVTIPGSVAYGDSPDSDSSNADSVTVENGGSVVGGNILGALIIELGGNVYNPVCMSTVNNSGTINSFSTFEAYGAVTNNYNDGVTKGTINGGTFHSTVNNSGLISGGTFELVVTNNSIGYIEGGTFQGQLDNNQGIMGSAPGNIVCEGTCIVNNTGVINYGTYTGTTVVNNTATAVINGGTFESFVTIHNYATIAGAYNPTFTCHVTNYAGGHISGGVFNSTVDNSGSITDGEFNAQVINYSGANINTSIGTFTDLVNNLGGTVTNASAHFTGGVLTNSGLVVYAQFEQLTNNAGGEVNGGLYVNLTNYGTVSGGTFTTINNDGTGLLTGTVSCSDLVNTNGTISGGTFNGHINFAGDSATSSVVINGGIFNSTVEVSVDNDPGGNYGIFGGTFNGEVTLTFGSIGVNGVAIFNSAVINNGGQIFSGTFNVSASVVNKYTIWGGTFYCTVDNQLTVGGGNFYGPFINTSSLPYVVGVIVGGPEVVIYRTGTFISNGIYSIVHQIDGQEMKAGSVIKITGIQHGINGSGILGTI
jgi:hypothetical protein